MIQSVAHVPLIVRDYDEALAFYRDVLGFHVAEDSTLPGGKRWVLLQAPGGGGSQILLSKAASPSQQAAIGNQTGGRVLFFFHTDAFDADYQAFAAQGVVFTEGPRNEAYGKVAIFQDLYGNRIDLIERRLATSDQL